MTRFEKRHGHGGQTGQQFQKLSLCTPHGGVYGNGGHAGQGGRAPTSDAQVDLSRCGPQPCARGSLAGSGAGGTRPQHQTAAPETLQLEQRLRDLLRAWPSLTAFGLCSGISDFARARAELAKSHAQVAACVDLLASAPRTRHGSVSSYYLKHVLERASEARGQFPYFTNGAAIAACLLLDFDVRPRPPTPNADVNIARGWLKALAKGALP